MTAENEYVQAKRGEICNGSTATGMQMKESDGMDRCTRVMAMEQDDEKQITIAWNECHHAAERESSERGPYVNE